MSVTIHPTAVVEPGAELGEGCDIGPHAVIHASVRMGKGNRVFAQAVVGGEPQDLKFKGERTFLEIGDHNLIRECVTLNRAVGEGRSTRIGSHNLFMACSHVAHDCVVGSHVVLANSVAMAGHSVIGDHAVVGGMTGLHQFARVGMHAMVGAMGRISKDILPFSTTAGCDEVKCYGLNKVGLKRRGFSPPDLEALEQAMHLYLSPNFTGSEALLQLEALPRKTEHVRHLIDFIKASTRGVYR